VRLDVFETDGSTDARNMRAKNSEMSKEEKLLLLSRLWQASALCTLRSTFALPTYSGLIFCSFTSLYPEIART
jgi:hypothetical protein